MKLTVCISYLALVLESGSHSNAENQKDPIDVRDVDLPKEFLGCVHYLYTGKATKCKSLLYYRVGCRYGGLTRNNCRRGCYNKGWPEYGF